MGQCWTNTGVALKSKDGSAALMYQQTDARPGKLSPVPVHWYSRVADPLVLRATAVLVQFLHLCEAWEVVFYCSFSVGEVTCRIHSSVHDELKVVQGKHLRRAWKPCLYSKPVNIIKIPS